MHNEIINDKLEFQVYRCFPVFHIGTIVIGSRNNERIIDKPLEVLNNDNISAVVTSARAAELLLSKHPNVFTTAPDISSVAEVSFYIFSQ